MSREQLLTQPFKGQQQHASFRRQTAHVLRNDAWFAENIQQDRHSIFISVPILQVQHRHQPDVLVAHLLASHVEQNTEWAGGYAIRALAVAIQRTIVVINTFGSALFLKSTDAVWKIGTINSYVAGMTLQEDPGQEVHSLLK